MPSPRHLKKAALAVVLVLLTSAAVLLLIPPALYFYGLHLVGTPTPPALLANPQEQLCVWQTIERTTNTQVQPVTPWVYLRLFTAEDPLQAQPPGFAVASVAARQYVHHRHGQMGAVKWHFTTAVVAIWLTRNWSAAELAAELLPTVRVAPNGRIATECGVPPNHSLQRTRP